MQYSKETYVLFGCAYCHGLDLTPRGEATDLRSSVLVGGDRNANLIGPLLRAGIPQTAKLSPMPQFSDLSDQQIGAIARWIHYARQRARYKELSESSGASGDVVAGRAYFAKACASCHATDRDLAAIGRKHDQAALRAQILEPRSLAGQPSYQLDRLRDTRISDGRERAPDLARELLAPERGQPGRVSPKRAISRASITFLALHRPNRFVTSPSQAVVTVPASLDWRRLRRDEMQATCRAHWRSGLRAAVSWCGRAVRWRARHRRKTSR